jgi:hypothetical protein
VTVKLWEPEGWLLSGKLMSEKTVKVRNLIDSIAPDGTYSLKLWDHDYHKKQKGKKKA